MWESVWDTNKFVKNNISDATISDIENYLIDKQETDIKNSKMRVFTKYLMIQASF